MVKEFSLTTSKRPVDVFIGNGGEAIADALGTVANDALRVHAKMALEKGQQAGALAQTNSDGATQVDSPGWSFSDLFGYENAGFKEGAAFVHSAQKRNEIDTALSEVALAHPNDAAKFEAAWKARKEQIFAGVSGDVLAGVSLYSQQHEARYTNSVRKGEIVKQKELQIDTATNEFGKAMESAVFDIERTGRLNDTTAGELAGLIGLGSASALGRYHTGFEKGDVPGRFDQMEYPVDKKEALLTAMRARLAVAEGVHKYETTGENDRVDFLTSLVKQDGPLGHLELATRMEVANKVEAYAKAQKVDATGANRIAEFYEWEFEQAASVNRLPPNWEQKRDAIIATGNPLKIAKVNQTIVGVDAHSTISQTGYDDAHSLRLSLQQRISDGTADPYDAERLKKVTAHLDQLEAAKQDNDLYGLDVRNNASPDYRIDWNNPQTLAQRRHDAAISEARHGVFVSPLTKNERKEWATNYANGDPETKLGMIDQLASVHTSRAQLQTTTEALGKDFPEIKTAIDLYLVSKPMPDDTNIDTVGRNIARVAASRIVQGDALLRSAKDQGFSLFPTGEESNTDTMILEKLRQISNLSGVIPNADGSGKDFYRDAANIKNILIANIRGAGNLGKESLTIKQKDIDEATALYFGLDGSDFPKVNGVPVLPFRPGYKASATEQTWRYMEPEELGIITGGTTPSFQKGDGTWEAIPFQRIHSEGNLHAAKGGGYYLSLPGPGGTRALARDPATGSPLKVYPDRVFDRGSLRTFSPHGAHAKNEAARTGADMSGEEFIRSYQGIVEALKADGLDARITTTTRSAEEQERLYAQGRTEPGPIVTNARGGQSRHQSGEAVDIHIFRDGKISNDPKDYEKLGQLAKEKGLVWGGDWKSIKDYGHIEMPSSKGNTGFGATTATASKIGEIDFDTFAKWLGGIENNTSVPQNERGYTGDYQFGTEALERVGYIKPGTSERYRNSGVPLNKALDEPANWEMSGGKKQFLADKAGQKEALRKLTQLNYDDAVARGIIKPGMKPDQVANILMHLHQNGLQGYIEGKRQVTGYWETPTKKRNA